ncbi:hypothetical protein F511_46216 [Dorcoceras hygrometricum]|uniref:Uncharacterized protein n=1 Tax=Dorcoceras hygrometricum TaxID=472368 RepID=A0A2Z6ZUJ6_9LAMI|nr:hypothetical protein F511_46216 [Dorcoceras hygrometricum]
MRAAHPLKRPSARDSRTWLYTSRALADASARCCASRRSCCGACRRSWPAAANLLCALVARDRGQRLARDDGCCPTQGGARDIAQRCDVEAPLLARWPDDAAVDGRRLNARWSRDHRLLAERYRATLAVEVRCCARLRALPPRSSWWWCRRPAAAPAMLRRCRDG